MPAILGEILPVLKDALGGLMSAAGGLLSGVVSTVGQGIVGAASAVMGAVRSLGEGLLKVGGSIVDAVLKSCSGLASLVASAGSAITGALGGVLGGVLSAAGGVLSGILGAAGGILSAIVSTVGQVIQAAANALVSALRTLGEAFMKLGGIVLNALMSGLMALGSAVVSAVKATIQFAHNVALIRANTGLGLKQSADMTSRFGAFGIDAKALAGMLSGANMSKGVFGSRAGMFNLPGYQDKNFIPQLAALFKSMQREGPYGQARANSMLKTLGMDTPEIRLIVNLPPEKIQKQAAFQEKLNTRFGLSPDVLTKYAEDVPLAMNRIGSVIQAFVQRLATAALPMVERALNLAQNLGTKFLPVFEGIFNTIGEYLDSNGKTIEDGIYNSVMWLYTTLPVLVVKGLIFIVGGASAFVGMIAGLLHKLADNLPNILNAFAAIMNGLRDFMAFCAGVAAYITSLRGLAYAVLHGEDTSQIDNPGVAFLNAQGKFKADHPDITGPDAAKMQTMLHGTAKDLTNSPMVKGMDDFKVGMQKWVDGQPTPEERRAQFESLKATQKATEATQKATEEAAMNSRKIEKLSDIAIGLNNYVAGSAYNAAFNGG